VWAIEQSSCRASGRLPSRIAASLEVIFIGYALGILIAFELTILAITSRVGNDFLETC
jgi:NitT/TauT family transport system permease protein